MSTARSLSVTVDEYLTCEEAEASRNEFLDGWVAPMTGGSPRHADIISNLLFHLRTKLRERDCKVVANDMRLWVESAKLFTYPDIMVTCGDRTYFESAGTMSLTNPVLIAEVLSKATRNYDKGDKFTFYRSIPSVMDYLTIEQDCVGVERHYKSLDGKWHLEEFAAQNGDDVIGGCDLKVSMIYDGIRELEASGSLTL